MIKSRRKIKKCNLSISKNVIIGVFILTFLFATGYSAFSSNISLKAKGNIKKFTVNFDANGGNLDIKNKVVIYNSNYGVLPTPTKEGYIFKGWHGKNMLNVSDKDNISNGLHYTIKDEVIHIHGENTEKDEAFGLLAYDSLYTELKPNTKYTLSVYNLFDDNIYVQMNYWIKNATTQGAVTSVVSTRHFSVFTIPDNYDRFAQIFIGIKKTAQKIDETFKVQVEEGENYSDWEPYYITSNTKVVQKKDHTLTAIWEKQ